MATPPSTPQPPPEFDKVVITLEVNGDIALFILLAEDGLVNRMGSGTINNCDREMFIGRSPEPLCDRLMARFDFDLLAHRGRYELPDRQGAHCELSVLFGCRQDRTSLGFEFVYGSESEGPLPEIADFVRHAAELTAPWHEERKRAAQAHR